MTDPTLREAIRDALERAHYTLVSEPYDLDGETDTLARAAAHPAETAPGPETHNGVTLDGDGSATTASGVTYPAEGVTPEAALSALVELRNLTECRCTEDWTKYGRHAPECDHEFRDDVEVLAAALRRAAAPGQGREQELAAWLDEQIAEAERRAGVVEWSTPVPSRVGTLREVRDRLRAHGGDQEDGR